MNPTELVGPSGPLGYPAPYWFLVLFKVLGFSLHIIPMNIWYAGIILCMLFHWRGGEYAKRLSDRLMNQMPIIIALGINFGIVPLLFMQVAYYKVFYPATVLMAWPWFTIIVLLTLAYYGVYYYATGLRKADGSMTRFRIMVGWVTAILFIIIGFLFSNALSLMTNVKAWPELWEKTSVAAAPLGIALNTADPTLWPRWLMMFGLALTTTGAYVVVDTGFFARGEAEGYRRGAMRVALKVYTVGLLWFALAGSWYVFGTWSMNIREMMFSGPLIVFTALTAMAPGLPWLLILLQRSGVKTRLALLTGLAQLLVVVFNAISRQIVQNAELSPYFDLTAERVNTQWSPLIVFLLLFLAGVAVVVWMLRNITSRKATVSE